jgi:hypothetical protein
VYLALATGPVGAVNGPGAAASNAALDTYDRVIGQGPALAYAERLLGVAVLTQVTPGPNGENGEFATAGRATGAVFQQWWQALQGLPSPGSRPQHTPVAPAAAGSQGLESTPEEEKQISDDEATPGGPMGTVAEDPGEDSNGDLAHRTPPDRRDAPGGFATVLAVSAVFAAWGGPPPRPYRRQLGQTPDEGAPRVHSDA